MMWLVVAFWFVVLVAGYVHDRRACGRRRLPVRHRPDYAKIAQLERELGLSDVCEHKWKRDACPRCNPRPPDPEFQVPDPRRPVIADRPPMFKTYEDYMTWLRAKNPPPDK